ncbi:uncharacterized protein [Rutidosis leptorrhynchoides]|uniref:uncharacterized protein n=1 Tax=Rutidosis leptorrhynchoides TaxID=125765 RepID=UPI003A990F29
MLESNKSVLVADRIKSNNPTSTTSWNWTRPPNGRNLTELAELNNLVATITLSDKPDTWKWNLDQTGIFTTKALASILDNLKLNIPTTTIKTPRNKLIPQKINIFIWRVLHERIPTHVELEKRGVDLDSILCPLCNLHIESIEHILFHCSISSNVLKAILQWWNLPDNTFSNLIDITSNNQSLNASQNGAYIWQAIKWASTYIIWKFRNLKVFGKKEWCVATILSEIQTQSFAWISKRFKKSILMCHQWLVNPLFYISPNSQRSGIG